MHAAKIDNLPLKPLIERRDEHLESRHLAKYYFEKPQKLS